MNTERWSISPHSVQMRENADQNDSEYEHFSRSAGSDFTQGINPDSHRESLEGSRGINILTAELLYLHQLFRDK